jgi:hypothetical protein
MMEEAIRRNSMRTCILCAVIGVAFLNMTPSYGQSSVEKLSETQVEHLLKTIRPSEGEDPFATIPWQTNLWDARKLAAKEGKPILLWEMDGHPLGCG